MPKAMDITGERFNKLVAIRFVKRDQHGNPYWLFECDCGNQKVLGVTKVKSGSTKTCGCGANKAMDIAGQRLGSLVAIKRVGTDKHGSALWEFECDCGKKKVDVIRKAAKSCGCGLKKWRAAFASSYALRNKQRKPICKYGHDTRVVGRTSQGRCRACAKERYSKHPEEAKRYSARWRATHAEQIKRKSAEREATPQRIEQRRRRYRKKHPDVIRDVSFGEERKLISAINKLEKERKVWKKQLLSK